jgi:hypothetical protein
MKRVLYVLAVVGLLSACASTAENLQRETARSFGSDINPSDVAVSNINRGVTSVSWDAAAKGVNYNCSADDMVRRVYCVKK